ncbi:MAG: PAS domain-containing protein, partial [Terrimicrobiaceae bacterium]
MPGNRYSDFMMSSQTMPHTSAGETPRDVDLSATASLDPGYRRLFETSQDGILVIDFETRKVVDANPSF